MSETADPASELPPSFKKNVGSNIGKLTRIVPILSEGMSCGAVAEQLHREPETPAVVIRCENGNYGLIDRSTYLPRFLDRFNRDLFHRKPISLLMDKDPLIVDWAMPIERAGMLAAGGDGQTIRSAFIILRDGACAGIGLGTDLMRLVAAEAQGRLIDLRQAQDNLVQAQTFASLGRLVAGVAHEINTPIGVSLTASSYLRERLMNVMQAYREKRLQQSDFVDFATTAEEASSIVVDNIERAADMIRSFKSVAVDQTSAVRRVFKLRELIDNTLRSVSPALRKGQMRSTSFAIPRSRWTAFQAPSPRCSPTLP